MTVKPGDRSGFAVYLALPQGEWTGREVFVDSRALIAAIFGAAVGAAVAYPVVKRQWRRASSICAVGMAVLLGIVTEGNRSRPEHNVVLAVELALLGYVVVAARAGMQARRCGHM